MGGRLMTIPNQTVDYDAITESNRDTWGAGDYRVIANYTRDLNEELIRAVDPLPGQRVLDVACGSGNAALAAARRYCEVTGVDFVPKWVGLARERAAFERLQADFRIADARDLPFPDASFDAVVSAVGIMFVPDQEKAASELLRVCRPGGTIGLASWTPEGSNGRAFAAFADFMPPPPPGLDSPLRWGTREGIEDLLGAGTRSIENSRRETFAYFHSFEHEIQIMRDDFGPMKKLFESVPPERHDELIEATAEALSPFHTVREGAVVEEAEYLQTIAIRS